MRVVALMSLLVLVHSAPLNEQNMDNDIQQEDAKVIMVKRAKEFMMFGDQQGEYKEKEKRAEALDDTVDEQGSVVAHPAEEIPVEQPSQEEDSLEVEAPQIHSEENTELPVADNMENVEETVGDSPAESEEEEDGVPEGSEEIEEGPQDSPVDNDIADRGPESEIYDDYLKNYKDEQGNYLMNLLNSQYNNQWEPPTPRYQNSYNLYDYLTGARYRRSEHRGQKAVYPKNHALKRAHRIKRDLYFTSDILGRNYDPYEEPRYVETPYGSEQVDLDDNEIRYLLNLLDNTERYDDDVTGYDNQPYPASAGYYEPEVESDDSGYYIPKRQAGLTFVPGLKRSSSGFFPYFEEPGTHFPLFVPQKRSRNDYADAYQTLMELAGELRPESYYPEEEYENYYRRRK